MTHPVDPYGLDRAGLEALAAELGEPRYRGRQLLGWLARGVDDPEAMTDLPRPLRARLAGRFTPARPELVRHTTADDGATHKFLLRFPDAPGGGDGTLVETVLMLYPRRGGASARATVCVSTQAGCAMGCPFCATGQAGLRRQLTAGEIVRQVVLADAFLREQAAADDDWDYPDHVTNVVYMGMGEPLANPAATEASLRWLHAGCADHRAGRRPARRDGFALSARAITVSTVGIVPGIRRLAALGLPVTLAVSLHAPDDALRDVLVPVNRLYPLDALLAAVAEWEDAVGRRVSYEYVIIDGVNDGAAHARALGDLLRRAGGRGGAHVNLIPLNPTPGVPDWRPPPPRRVEEFVAVLAARGINTTVRDTRGRSVDAACGQLLADYRLGEGRRLPVAADAAERVDALRTGA